ncbi:hypothetical protein GCM10025864_11190 [Luteimicrobium album]|uniref:Transposase n=1 Tax=Luteimicrobium album TaxID=1054550 RepID=A0ABQ6HY74_9MICO|nr:hypothetical protein GCM10025864_11190 [Luteimicrobium album]
MCLDGTLEPIAQLHGRPKNPSGTDSWPSGKQHRYGGNIPVVCDASEYPVLVSPVSPGPHSRHRRRPRPRAARAVPR